MQKVPDEIYRVLEEGGDEEELLIEPDTTPQTLEDFISEMKSNRSDAKTFALRLKAMVFIHCNSYFIFRKFS